MGVNRRRDQRYHVHMRAAIVRGRNELWLETDNISMRGVFVLTATPPALRDLVSVRFMIPGQEADVTFSGMAVHVVTPARATGDRPAGAGIQFYGMGGVDATRWQHFIRDIRQAHPQSLERAHAVNLLGTAETPGIRLLDTDRPGKIRVRTRTPDELFALYQQNISRGALMLPSQGDQPLGQALEIVLVHPSNGKIFNLTGVVQKNVRRDGEAKVAVALSALTPRRKAELLDFVNSDIPVTISDDFAAS